MRVEPNARGPRGGASRDWRAMVAIAGVLVATGLAGGPIAAARAAADAPVALIEINGEAITDADLDALILASHRSGDMSQRDNSFFSRLLEKAVRDRLLLQDARAMGLDEEPLVAEALLSERLDLGASLYAREHFAPPDSVEADAIRDYFEQFYHRIQLRQISVGTPEEAMQIVLDLRAGADMDSLARAVSIDSRRARGGLHHDVYWRDVELPLRAAAEGLPVGALSEVFPYNEAWSVVRVESRKAADASELSAVEKEIREAILAQRRREAWKEFVAEVEREHPVQSDSSVLADLRSDADLLLRSEFVKADVRPALWVDERCRLSGYALRKAMSATAMQMGTAGFDSVLATTLRAQSERLALSHAAESEGLLEREDAVRRLRERQDQLLLQTYLKETVADQIRFRRAAIDSFYDAHREDFRGPEQVRLSILTLDEEAVAREAARRLREGADFDYVRRELTGQASAASDADRWTSLSVFSQSLQDALRSLEPGQTTEAIDIGSGWIVVRLDGRRPGPLPAREDVELQIRQALFQREFGRILDRRLAKLRQMSEIIRHDDRISAYFEAESK